MIYLHNLNNHNPCMRTASTCNIHNKVYSTNADLNYNTSFCRYIEMFLCFIIFTNNPYYITQHCNPHLYFSIYFHETICHLNVWCFTYVNDQILISFQDYFKVSFGSFYNKIITKHRYMLIYLPMFRSSE